MAIYHLSIKIFSRGKGRSAVAAAAYRAGEIIKNEYDGKVHDYTHRNGVAYTEIMLPKNAPPEYLNRSILWNAVEKVEKARNSQLAREIEIALPAELTKEENISLVREYVKQNFVDAGMCADICIHDINGVNPHAHIMLTVRPFNDDKAWGDKQKKVYILDDDGNKIYDPVKRQYNCNKVQTTDWHEQTKAEEWRAAWAEYANNALELSGSKNRIDHRSYKRQGLTIIPSIKLGKAAHQMEKRGIRTERGDINREIAITNQEIRRLRARIRKAKDWLYSQPLENAPTMVDVMKNVAAWKNLNNKWQKVDSLKAKAQMLIFLENNGISDFSDLAKKTEQMHRQVHDLSEKVKQMDRRLETLDIHLEQYGILQANKAIVKKYNSLNGKSRSAYLDKHSNEIHAYREAKSYLDNVMNGKSPIPFKAWESEKKKLTTDRIALSEKYYDLKDEIKVVESLRRSAESLINEEKREEPLQTHNYQV